MKKYIIGLFFIQTFVYAKINIECKFNTFSDNSGKYTTEELKVNIEIIENGKVYATGNNKRVPVKMLMKDYYDSISFIEITPSGNLNTISIDKNTNKAVYSRHVILLGNFMPSQHYGQCTMLDTQEGQKSLTTSAIRQKISSEVFLADRIVDLPKSELKIIINILNGIFPKDIKSTLSSMTPKGKALFSEISIKVGQELNKGKN